MRHSKPASERRRHSAAFAQSGGGGSAHFTSLLSFAFLSAKCAAAFAFL
jgi:hypothetical protein